MFKNPSARYSWKLGAKGLDVLVLERFHAQARDHGCIVFVMASTSKLQPQKNYRCDVTELIES